MKRILLSLLCGSLCAASLFGVETKFWVQNDQSTFEKGTLKKISLRSDGRLMLAPVLREMFDPAAAYLWTVAQDAQGTLYTAGGGYEGPKAKVFAINPAGQGRTLAEVEGLEIHALAVNRQGEVFAATSPDSKVYRIGRDGKSTLFYDPKAKYVWAMAFNSKGDLFLATGDQGDVHRVSPDGRGTVFFKTDETHARSLAVDAQDNLILGTEPSGLILRVSPAGEGFVLHQAGKREVTAVAVARDGSIYAAAVGTKLAGTTPAPSTIPVTPPAPSAPAAPNMPAAARPATPPPTGLTLGGPSVTGGSEVYRIDRDGSVRRVWSHAQEIVYTVAFDGQGRPLLGTGNRGNIYRLDSDLLSTLLVNPVPTQVTALLTGAGSRVYAVTANIGKVYQIGPELERQGTYDSEVLDAGQFAYWGRLAYKTEGSSPGTVAFTARSGNLDRPQKNWSPLTPVPLQGDGGRIAAPAARFAQYRATLNAGPDGSSPELVQVEVGYLPKNVAPVVTGVEVAPSNYRFTAPTLTLTPSRSLTLPPVGQPRRSSTPAITTETSDTLQYAKGFLSVRWSASDENGDDLLYTVEMKGTRETTYKLLKDKVAEKHLSWDSTAFPDGEYRIRVTATDAPDNPPGQALTSRLEGDTFIIDNTPPQITNLAGTAQGKTLSVSWRAKDTLSVITKAEYSVNGGEWLVIEPTTRLSDARELEYRLSLDRANAGEQTVAVRLTDESENQSVEKVVVR